MAVLTITAVIGGRGTEEISEWLQGGFCIHDLHACMIGFRSDHACIMHKSETDWMHAGGQPASARAWLAASGQLAGWRVDFWGTQSRQHDIDPIAAHDAH